MKKYVNAVYLALILFVLTGCSCSENRMSFYDQTKTTDLSELFVSGISLTSIDRDVIREFGKPDQSEVIEQPSTLYLIYQDDQGNNAVEFRIDRDQYNKVGRIYITSSDFRLGGQLGCGSLSADIVDHFGDDYYKRQESGGEILGYFDKVHQRNIEFSVNEENKVDFILISSLEPN